MQEGVDSSLKVAYRMKAKPRGIAVIINNKNFTSVKVGSGWWLCLGWYPVRLCTLMLIPSQDRNGTDRDAKALVELFMFLGFKVMRYNDLKSRDMRHKLQVRTADREQDSTTPPKLMPLPLPLVSLPSPPTTAPPSTTSAPPSPPLPLLPLPLPLVSLPSHYCPSPTTSTPPLPLLPLPLPLVSLPSPPTTAPLSFRVWRTRTTPAMTA